MRKQTAKLFVLFAICLLANGSEAQNRRFSRPTVVTAVCDEEPLWHEKIYEDEKYLFVVRDYGKPEYAPNFFAFGKKQRKWTEIIKLSTEHAKLGRSAISAANGDAEKNKDDRLLKNVNYMYLPLRVSDSINFPDRITYDARTKIYHFNFNSKSGDEEMWLRFFVLKEDLDQMLK